jgi:glycyl-tRNA synthetase beta chain
LALADRIDSLVGIFALGLIPSGAKDPFALRRAAVGVLRILIEGHLDLDLESLLQRASEGFDASLRADCAVEPAFEFVMERLRAYYLDQGYRGDEFESVLRCRPSRPLDFHKRLLAVAKFRTLPEADSLAAANKRIRNILKQVQGTIPSALQREHLEEAAEAALADRLVKLSSQAIPLMEAGSYDEALALLAALREPVDRFFDEVMVMTENETLRGNRLALLNELSSLFSRVADFSRLQS